MGYPPIMLSDRRLRTVRRCLDPLLWTAVVVVAMCIWHWHTPASTWQYLKFPRLSVGWHGQVDVYRVGDDHLAFNGPPGTKAPIHLRVGYVWFRTTECTYGYDFEFQKSIHMTEPWFEPNQRYNGTPTPEEVHAIAMTAAKPNSMLEPAAAAVMSPGQTVVYFHHEVEMCKEYTLLIWQRLRVSICLSLAVVGAVGVMRLFTSRSAPPPGLCRNCGYLLQGLASPRCPECGHEAASEVEN